MKQGWEMVKLAKVLKPSENWVAVVPTDRYKMLGLSLEGRGLFVREEKLGSEVSAKYLNKVVPGEFMYSRLFAWKGAFDKASKDFEGCYVSDEFPAFQPDNDKLDIDFLAYFFRQKSVWIAVEQFCMGVTKASRNRFKEQFFLNFEIPLPPLSEQQHIAGRLAALKGKIDAVRGLRGEQVREVERVAQSYGEQFFEELGKEVPTRLFEEICDVVRGGSPRPAGDPTFYGDGYLPFLKIGDVTNDNEIYVQGYAETITKAGLTKTRVVEPNTLLLTNSGATLGVPKITAFKTAFNDGIQAFINFNEEVNLEYLYFFLKSKTGHFRKILARGQGQPNLNTEMVKKTSIPFPSLSEQRRIVSEIKAFQTKMQALKTAQAGQLSALEGLFPGVLEQAFRGEW